MATNNSCLICLSNSREVIYNICNKCNNCMICHDCYTSNNQLQNIKSCLACRARLIKREKDIL